MEIGNFDQIIEQVRALPTGLLLGIVIIAIIINFIPTYIAFFTNRANIGKIFLVNIFSGLSWIAWVSTFAWAMSGKMQMPEILSKKGVLTKKRQSRIWLSLLLLIIVGTMAYKYF